MRNRNISLLVSLALLLGTGLWLAGCSSDSVAPHEQAPALSSDDVAHQAGAMGSAAAQVLPQIVEFSDSNKNEYTYTFPAQGDVSGVVYFDFRLGGAQGTPATFNAADYGRMYTAADAPIVFEVGIGGSVEVDFQILADIDQGTDTATLLEGSSGTFTAGDYTASFSFENVVVTAGAAYPGGGTMTFVSGGHTVVLTFNGTHTATISYNGVISWTVNLDDGSLTEVG